MTIAQKSKEIRVGMKDEGRNGINLCSVYPANNPYVRIRWVASDNSAAE